MFVKDLKHSHRYYGLTIYGLNWFLASSAELTMHAETAMFISGVSFLLILFIGVLTLPFITKRSNAWVIFRFLCQLLLVLCGLGLGRTVTEAVTFELSGGAVEGADAADGAVVDLDAEAATAEARDLVASLEFDQPEDDGLNRQLGQVYLGVLTSLFFLAVAAWAFRAMRKAWRARATAGGGRAR